MPKSSTNFVKEKRKGEKMLENLDIYIFQTLYISLFMEIFCAINIKRPHRNVQKYFLLMLFKGIV